MYKYINDIYRQSRGGRSSLLDVSCEHCGYHLDFYQKDGPGPLKRLYIDRLIELRPLGDELACAECKTVLGLRINYSKEDRPAYRLFAGAVRRKVVNKYTL